MIKICVLGLVGIGVFILGYCCGFEKGKKIGYQVRDDFLWWLSMERTYD